ncbi:MAG: hypothetical protein JXQ87_13795 [Bacteroidia bacterium]
MKKLFFLMFLFFASFCIAKELPRKYRQARAIGLYGGFNSGMASVGVKNKSIQLIDGFNAPSNSSSLNFGGQIGLQYIGRNPEITLFGIQTGYHDYEFSRNFENVPLSSSFYSKEIEYDWRESFVGLRVIRLLGYYYERTIPMYLDFNYSRLSLRGMRFTNESRDDIDNRQMFDGLNEISNGFSTEIGFYLKYLNIGFYYSFYPNVYTNGSHELSDGLFNNASINPEYSSFNANAATSLSSFCIKIRFNLYALTWGRCSAGHEGFSWGHRYDFDYFWKSSW